MAIPKTPKPPVSSVAVVSGVGGAVVASAASGAVVVFGAGVLVGDEIGFGADVAVSAGSSPKPRPPSSGAGPRPGTAHELVGARR